MSKRYSSLEERIRRAAPPTPHLPKALRTQVLHHATTTVEQELHQRRLQAIGAALMLWLGLSGFFFIALPRPSEVSTATATDSEKPASEWDLVESTRRLQQDCLRVLRNAF